MATAIGTVFNSREYAWVDVNVVMLGREVVGLRGIEYKSKRQKEALFASGRKARSNACIDIEIDELSLLLVAPLHLWTHRKNRTLWNKDRMFLYLSCNHEVLKHPMPRSFSADCSASRSSCSESFLLRPYPLRS